MGGCCIGNCCVGDIPIIREIKDFFCSDCCVGYTPSRSDSEIHAEKIANELADMIERVDESTKKFVETLLPYLSEDINTLFAEIEQINDSSYGGKKLKIDLKTIEQKNKEMENQAKTLVGNMMRDRLVFTDPELAVILEEKDDKKRGKNFEKFVAKLRNKANEDLFKELEEIVKRQQAIISTEIESRLTEIDRSVQRSNEEFNKIIDLKQRDEPALEAEKIKYIYKRGVCDLILNEMNTQEAVS